MDELFHPSLIYAPPKHKDNILGGITRLPHDIVLASGDWRPYVLAHEKQNQFGLETFNCTGFAATNVIESLFHHNFGIKMNFSDRALAVAAGTGQGGNLLSKVADTIRDVGLAQESTWPWLPEVNTEAGYIMPVSFAVKVEEEDFHEFYDIDWEWCYPEVDAVLSFKTALKFSPIAIGSQYAYESSKDAAGVYHPNPANPVSHSTCLLFIDEDGYKYVQDSYVEPIKKLSPDFPIPYGLRYWAARKSEVPAPMPAYHFLEDHRYFLADAGGATLFFLGGKLRHDDLAKCLDQWIGRNDGDIKGKSATITTVELVGVPLYNLKGEPVNL